MKPVGQLTRKIQIGNVFALLLIGISASALRAQPPLPPSYEPDRRIEQLENVVFELRQQVQQLEDQQAWVYGNQASVESDPATHYLVYDKGWVIRPNSVSRTPFELQFNFHQQLRHTGFAPSVDTFTDSAGITRPIASRNDFDINRGRLVFSGFAFDPNLQFYTNVDYNSVSAEPVQLLLSSISYRFGDGLTMAAGKGKVPGGWEWEESSRYSHGAERTMATTFFRPSITAGIWAKGTINEKIHYHGLIGDGFNTFTLQASELDTNLVYSGILWWEPLTKFGRGVSDLEYHEHLALRTGSSITYNRSAADPLGQPGPEQTVIRLSDGTRLIEPGALAPNVTVNQFDLSLYTIHIGAKFRGASLAAEYYLRSINSLQGTGSLPISSLFDHGYYLRSGYFTFPKRCEFFVYGSQVSGDYGTGSEVGGGLNWFLKGERGARITFDVAHIEESPAQQSRTGLVAGGSGVLFRTQLWTFF